MAAALQCADVIAFEVTAALDAYEAHLAKLPRAAADGAGLADVDADMRRVCRRCLRLPQLSVSCLALLLSHYRLLAELHRRGRQVQPGAPPLHHLQVHQACISRLQRQCRELMLAQHLH